MKAYFDNGATTPLDRDVVQAMLPYYAEKCGNASSLHYLGEEAFDALEESRATIAKSIKATPEEIIFTSGGTESNNMALLGRGKGHFVTSTIEHSAVLNPIKQLGKAGNKTTLIEVDYQGFIDIDQLQNSLTKETKLVSIIHGNHEIGTIQDLPKIYRICKDAGVIFHTDACQSFTKTKLDAKHADLITLNAHKIHGPKGVGALFIREGTELSNISFGGSQESRRRPGTENIPGIVGFAKAAEIGMRSFSRYNDHMKKLSKTIAEELLAMSETRLNGPEHGAQRLPNNTNISFDRAEGEAILMSLSLKGICVSTGSACSSQSLQPSHILKAVGLTHEQAHGAIRFSVSRLNTLEETRYVIQKVKEVVGNLREISKL